MERKEEMRNDNVEQQDTKIENDANSNTSSIEEAFDTKTYVATIIVFLLAIWGAVCLLLVPSLYQEIGTLKSQDTASNDLKKIEVTSEYIQEFTNYIDNINISDGLSPEEFVGLEKEYLNFFMVEMVQEGATSVYMEKKVIDKLNQALENTNDTKMQEMIKTMIEGHEEILESKEDELAEVEDMYIDIQNKDKELE